MESNSRSATDMDDQDQLIEQLPLEADQVTDRNIHLKGVYIDFVKTRPTSDLKLIFKDDASVKYKSRKFKNGVLVHWDLDIHLRIHTNAKLTVRRAPFKIRVAEISVKIEPREFGDDRVVCLEDSNHCVSVTFVCGRSISPTFPNTVAPMDTQQPHRRIPEFSFRVLIIGRANAGKTSILQRICGATEGPIIYRGNEEVILNPSMDRGEHRIDDEFVFSNHRGYVFHDSRGIESGGTEELDILQDFIRRKCGKTSLRDRLHAIWYCVPMDNQRPELDLKYFKDICPDRNVPVIAVFTKYDQFRRNVQIHVEDFGTPDNNVFDVAEKKFQEYYLRPLGDGVRFVRLEKMHMENMCCNKLIETTAAALNDDMVKLMLLAVQRGNLELSVKLALKRVDYHTRHRPYSSGMSCPVPIHLGEAYCVTAHYSKAHPNQSWRSSFDLCCYPHLEARDCLASLKDVSQISFNPRGG
ncbi:hypothetical protein EDB87DRAFT_1816200 [Lactarius vividus]|nr:hypothetical protein EDB87DRAFT_1816200 [Lactarius vividus]